MILKKLFWTLKFVDSLLKLTLGSIWETLRWPPIPGRNITSVTEFGPQILGYPPPPLAKILFALKS